MGQQRVVHWVLPAYNEAASIGDLIDRIVEVSEEREWAYRIVVVDDGSDDATGQVASSRAPHADVRVLRNEPNQGLGRTIRRGLKVASEDGGGDDVIVTMDADLTHAPAYAPSMLERLDEGYEVVIASRYRDGSGIEGLSATRRMLSAAASTCVGLARPIPGVRDYSCGFRAYRAEVVRQGFERFGDGFVSEPGFACMLEIAQNLRGIARFSEVPFVLHYEERRKPSTMRVGSTISAYFRVMARAVLGRRA